MNANEEVVSPCLFLSMAAAMLNVCVDAEEQGRRRKRLWLPAAPPRAGSRGRLGDLGDRALWTAQKLLPGE